MGSAAKLGVKATLNYNTGTYGSPVWSVCAFVSDLTVTASWDVAEGATRVSRVKTKLKTMMELSITGKFKNTDTGDTNYQTIIAGLIGDTILNFMVLNGGTAENGAWGFMFDSQLKQANEDQGLGSVIFDDFEIFPATTVNAPQYALVASGSAAFTAF